MIVVSRDYVLNIRSNYEYRSKISFTLDKSDQVKCATQETCVRLIQNFEGDALEKIMGLVNALIKRTNAYKELDCDVYLRVHVLCVHPSYQHKGVGAALLKVCVQVTSTLDLRAIGGVFTSGPSQSLALKLGFRLIAEIRYSRWVVDDRVVFDDTGKGNYSAAFMGMRIPCEESHAELGDGK